MTSLNTQDISDYYKLRWKILRKPWDQPIGSEKDGLESEAFHVLARNEKHLAIGVGRLHFNSQEVAQIRYMAVCESFQNQGVGSVILSCLEQYAEKRGSLSIILQARETAISFYYKSGYRILGASYFLYGDIQHHLMVKQLCRQNEELNGH